MAKLAITPALSLSMEPLLPKDFSPQSVTSLPSKTDEARNYMGYVLEPLFSQGDTVAIASLTQKLITQEATPLQADVANYTASSIGGLTGIFGVAFHSLNLHRATKNKDRAGLKVYSAQLVRFIAKIASVVTVIASTILTKCSEVLARSSSILGAVSTMSGTLAFSLRLYDMHKLKSLNQDIEAIHKEFFQETEDLDAIEGQIDRLGRALGDRDLAVKIKNKEPISDNEIREKMQGTILDFTICLAVFIISDAINITALVIPIIKPVGTILSLAANSLWLTLVDGKFLVKELSDKKQMPTALKVTYIAQIVLAAASIVASTVFSFGAVPLAIGAAAVVATTVPHILGWLQRKKRDAQDAPQFSQQPKGSVKIANPSASLEQIPDAKNLENSKPELTNHAAA